MEEERPPLSPLAMRRDPRNPDTYHDSLLLAQREWRASDPAAIAWRSDVVRRQVGRDREELVVPYLGKPYVVTWPEAAARELETDRPASQVTHILLLHYLLQAEGTALTGEWVSFRQLPDGIVYAGAFHQRAEKPLAARFGSDLEAFASAAEALGGERWRMADASYGFRAFPRLPLAVLLWRADDEFPASASILFDASAGRYLPTEDLSAVGGTLSGRLLRWRP